MNYIVAADTDVGNTKSTNQDSLMLKVMQTSQGKMVLAVLCDGMGGLEMGEVASASVIKAFDHWAKESFPYLTSSVIDQNIIQQQWESIIFSQNEKLHRYGESQGVALGTTIVALLLTDTQYYILNVGDSRVYEISDAVRILTKDQTVVAREVELGNLTPEQAENDPRKSVLLQCVGASDYVQPDMVCGIPKQNAGYLLCSDGFRHEINIQEIYDAFEPMYMSDEIVMQQRIRMLIDLNKQRQERDNITAALIRTY